VFNLLVVPAICQLTQPEFTILSNAAFGPVFPFLILHHRLSPSVLFPLSPHLHPSPLPLTCFVQVTCYQQQYWKLACIHMLRANVVKM